MLNCVPFRGNERDNGEKEGDDTNSLTLLRPVDEIRTGDARSANIERRTLIRSVGRRRCWPALDFSHGRWHRRRNRFASGDEPSYLPKAADSRNCNISIIAAGFSRVHNWHHSCTGGYVRQPDFSRE
jgi:hypothetical protein